MAVTYRTITNAYQDSVKLMRVSREVGEERGVDETVAVMGTDENKVRLVESGMANREDLVEVGPNDLILAARDDDDRIADEAVAAMETELRGSRGPRGDADVPTEQAPRSIASAVDRLPDASVALISVPGEYAAREAWKGLHEGLHVHIFSDNVDIADERSLKEFGRENGQIVMGPDCGTAILDGVPLGFANVVSDGSIGVVAAAGTGLQEVTTLIDRAGEGITQAIGTGGRDLSDAIGGITMRQGLGILEDDDETAVILLVSKPPEDDTMDAVLEDVASCDKPVVVHFVGGNPGPIEEADASPAGTLAEGAEMAVNALRQMEGGDTAAVDVTDGVTGFVGPNDAGRLVEGRSETDREAVRGLFTGGTLCAEAATILQGSLPTIRSNVGIGDPVSDPLDPTGNTIVDLGTDELTRGRPHPMIDPSIRTTQLERALDDEDILVVLLDVVLGYGAVEDPAAGVIEAVSGHRSDWPIVLASVCGTRGDSQGWTTQIDRLREAGVAVCASNADVAGLARAIHSSVTGTGGESE